MLPLLQYADQSAKRAEDKNEMSLSKRQLENGFEYGANVETENDSAPQPDDEDSDAGSDSDR